MSESPVNIEVDVSHFGWNEGVEISWSRPSYPDQIPDNLILAYITASGDMVVSVDGDELETVISEDEKWTSRTPTSCKSLVEYDEIGVITIDLPAFVFTYVDNDTPGTLVEYETVSGVWTGYYTQQSDTESYGSENYKTLTWYWQDIR